MIIDSVKVKNFRSIYDETLNCDNLTALIGPNGSGKSSFLKVLSFFYDPNSNYAEDDFYAKNTDENIEITVTFEKLNELEKEKFKKYVKNDKLTVKKIMKWPKIKGSQLYYGNNLINPEFDSFRTASGTTELRNTYKTLQETSYSELPDYSNKNNALKDLEKWEEDNPDKCILRQDEGQFFGFKEVGKAKLEEFTRFIYIPAVHDASLEASDGSKSIFKEIMDIVVRSALSQKREFIEMEERAQNEYDELIETETGVLNDLKEGMNELIGIYVPNSSINIQWEPNTLKIPVPNAKIELFEDDYGSPVENCGHGLQRAFLMSLFQYLIKIQSISEDIEESDSQFNLILGIEEPELYQHPNRQRYLSKILSKLANGSITGVADEIQLIYTTHSPLFVDLEQFDKIRKLDKIENDPENPKVTRVNRTNFEEVVEIVEKAEGIPAGGYTAEGFEVRLKAIMTPWMNEGFFADAVVLVEGIEDRAAILGLANELGHEIEGNGISIIPCMSKNNLHQPYSIFSKLKIPTYCIWDSDYNKFKNKSEKAKTDEIKKNHRLLRLCDHEPEDWPENVTDNFACFKNDLGDTMRNEIGIEVYDKIISDCVNKLDMRKKDLIKRPKVIEHLIKISRTKESASETLEEIIRKVIEMKE